MSSFGEGYMPHIGGVYATATSRLLVGGPPLSGSFEFQGRRWVREDARVQRAERLCDGRQGRERVSLFDSSPSQLLLSSGVRTGVVP